MFSKTRWGNFQIFIHNTSYLISFEWGLIVYVLSWSFNFGEEGGAGIRGKLDPANEQPFLGQLMASNAPRLTKS